MEDVEKDGGREEGLALSRRMKVHSAVRKETKEGWRKIGREGEKCG